MSMVVEPRQLSFGLVRSDGGTVVPLMGGLEELGRILVDDSAFAVCAGSYAQQRALWEMAVRHSVHVLLAWRIAEDTSDRWHSEWRATSRDALARAIVLEELQRRELARLTVAFSDVAIPALLLKGSAWAYTLYARPLLRPRDDTDVLVNASTRDRAEHLLLSLGYEPAVESRMELASAQRHYGRVDEHQVAHPLDLHWRVTNPLVFGDALPFERLWQRSVAVPVPGARTLCGVDALLLACLHRLAHHGSESALLWLMDVHLLASSLAPGEWDDFTNEAGRSRLRGVCAHSLLRAVEYFSTPVPAHIGTWLADACEMPERVFLGNGVSPLGVLISDWRAVGTWAGRLRLMKDHVCPPRSYMDARYGPRHPLMLPLLYGQRAIAGLRRWMMHGR
jgi:hypothetical protein